MYNGLERGLRDGELLAHTNGLITNDGIGYTSTYRPLINKIVAYYKFEGNFIESTGLSPNGTTAFSSNYTTGKIGSGFLGDGAQDKMMDVSDNDNFSFTNGGGVDVPFSISFWVKFSSHNGTYDWIMGKMSTVSGGDEWRVIYYQNRIQVVKFDRSNNAIYQGVGTPVSSLSLSTWYHFTFTDNGSKTVAGMKIYINGVLQTLTDLSAGVYTGMNNGSNIFRIGYPSFGTGSQYSQSFQGVFDEFGLWKNRALSAENVLQLYNGGNGLTYPF